MATNRLTELEKLQKDHEEAIKEVERLKMEVRENLEQFQYMYIWKTFVEELLTEIYWQNTNLTEEQHVLYIFTLVENVLLQYLNFLKPFFVKEIFLSCLEIL